MGRLEELLIKELHSHFMQRFDQFERKIMDVLTDLQNADTNLAGKVAKLIADFAAEVTAAGIDPAKLEQVAADMNAMSAQIDAADPVPGSGVTPDPAAS